MQNELSLETMRERCGALIWLLGRNSGNDPQGTVTRPWLADAKLFRCSYVRCGPKHPEIFERRCSGLNQGSNRERRGIKLFDTHAQGTRPAF